VKFEELLEAAVDLDKIPDEYLICASYDSGLQVCCHNNQNNDNKFAFQLMMS
jgi:hypothetical protein